jgi:carbon-monoxide dehydrogenase large subunit
MSQTVMPTKLNPLGAKGIGEGATIGVPPALVAAILDALRPLGVAAIAVPLTREPVWHGCKHLHEPGGLDA